MKRIFISILFSCLFVHQTTAQMTNEGAPRSWSLKKNQSRIDYYLMPKFNLEKQKKIDALNAASKTKPWQFGYEYTVNYGLNNSGTWTTLANGDRIWQIEIESKNALTMNFVFDDYHLPKGATVYLYNPKTKEVQGAYTHANNSADRMLGTTLIQGDNVVIEYYEPKVVQGLGALNISMVVHGYRQLGAYPSSKLTKGLNDAGDCHIDVNCPLGSGWQDQINSVALIIEGGNALCSGALINNTSNDGTPYFLTAEHCGAAGFGAWVFRFNWESPVPVCAQVGNSQDPGAPYNEINGAVLRAKKSDSDVLLLELNNTPTGNVYYAGWNRSTTPATQVTGIHHPSGDVKKISRDNDAAVFVNAGKSLWNVEGWDQGVTESGSSGSPLFNQNKLIVGQLLGGPSACVGTSGNADADAYGRFDVSWNGTSPADRLKDWLDPGNIGLVQQSGYDPNAPVLAVDAGVVQINGIEALYCGVDSFIPEILIHNYGSDTITTLEIVYDVDGIPYPNYSWIGTLAPNGIVRAFLPTITSTDGMHTFTAVTVMPNGMVDSNTVDDARSMSFSITRGGQQVDLELILDCFASETSWSLTDSATGQVLYSRDTAFYLDNFSTIDTAQERFCLTNGCYRYTIYDKHGDGMDGTGFCGRSGDYTIRDENGNELARMTAANGNFGDSAVHYFCLPYVVSNQMSIFNLNEFKVFPNPTDGIVYVNLGLKESENIRLELYTATGQLLEQVIAQDSTSEQFEFDLNMYSMGMYFVKLRVGDQTLVKKIVKN